MISKRGINGMEVPKKRTGLLFRETASANTRDDQNRTRAGCSTAAARPPVQKRSSENGKTLRPSMLSSSSGKEVVGSSRRASANLTKPLKEPMRGLSSSRLPAEEKGRESKSTNVIRAEVGKSGAVAVSSLRSQRPGLRQRETESVGPVRQAVSSKYGLRNLGCNTVSDVIRSSCSSSDSTLNRSKKTTVIKTRSSEGESSSTLKGKKMTGSSSLERLNSGTRNGRSSSDTRGSRNVPPLRDNSRSSVRTERTVSGLVRGRFSNRGNENSNDNNGDNSRASVRTERKITGYARGRFSNQGNENSKENNGDNGRASVKTERTVSGYGRGRFSKQGNENSKENNESGDVLPISPHSIDLNSPVTEEFCGGMPVSREEHNTHHSLIIQDGSRRHHNMDGISEVVLALERMEQDQELTREQIDLLENNSILDGLSYYDTHRDMRLDIDDMSYEELLALEERMGTVSTALSEEALSNSLKKSVYESTTPSDDAADCFDEDENDIKCCICQEEYVVGDEIGRLQCTHKYHVDCIQEWLRLKNWCPMCKESAALSNSSSSPSH